MIRWKYNIIQADSIHEICRALSGYSRINMPATPGFDVIGNTFYISDKNEYYVMVGPKEDDRVWQYDCIYSMDLNSFAAQLQNTELTEWEIVGDTFRIHVNAFQVIMRRKVG